MAPTSAPLPAHLPPPAFTLLYTRPKVYVHPTPYARDHVPGVLALLRDGAAPLPAHSLWLAFLPEAALPPRDDVFVHVRPAPGAPAAEPLDLELESDADAAACRDAVLAAFLAFYATATRADDAPVFLHRPPSARPPSASSASASAGASTGVAPAISDRLILTPPLAPEQHAFAFPLSAAQGLLLAAPTFSQWYGSVRVLFKSDQPPRTASIPLLTLFYHDDESIRTLEHPPDLEPPLPHEPEHAHSHQAPDGANRPRPHRPAGASSAAAAAAAATAAKAVRSPSSSSHSSSNLSRTSTPITQRASSTASSPAHKPPAPTWGGDELVAVLRRYTNVFRSMLQPGLILLNPTPETMAHHGSPYFEADAIDRPARHACGWARASDSGAPAGQAAPSRDLLGSKLVDEYDPGLDDIYRLDPYFLWHSTRSLVMNSFASITQSARHASQQVLSLSGASAGSTDASPTARSVPDLPGTGSRPGPATEERGARPVSEGTSPRPGGLSCLLEHERAPASASASTGDYTTSPAGRSTPVLRVSTPGSTGSETERGRARSPPADVPKSVRTRVRDYLHIGLSPLSKPIQTFAQAGPVPMGPLTDAEWGRISQQGGIEFDSARTYLSHWARLVADAGERCRRTEEAIGPSAAPAPEGDLLPGPSGPLPVAPGPGAPPAGADEVDEEVGQLGVFELLARCPDVPSLPSTRARAASIGPIAADEWNGWFDQRTGRLSRPVRAVKQAVFARGLAPDGEDTPPSGRARKTIWPFLLGVVDWHSTRDEREEAWSTKRAEYLRFKHFWEHDPALLAREDVLDQRSLIRKDCLRTDRNHPLFRTAPRATSSAPADPAPRVMSASIIQEKECSHAGASGNLHVARLGEVLLTYGFWEAHEAARAAAREAGEPAPELDAPTFAYQPYTLSADASEKKSLGGYVQGMSDLCSLVYIVCDGDEVATFWCFVQLMQRLAPNFFDNQAAIMGQLARLRRLLALMDPAFYAHVELADGLSLFFAYRWLLVGFRREFNVPDTLKLWDCMLAAEFTPLPRAEGASARPGDPKAARQPAADTGPGQPGRWKLWSRLAQVTGSEAGHTSHHRSCSPPPGPAARALAPEASGASVPRVGLTSGFSLFVALALMQSKRDEIMGELFEFDGILAFFNGLSHTLDVEQIIAAAEKAARAAKVLFHMRDATEGKPVRPLEPASAAPGSADAGAGAGAAPGPGGPAAAVAIPRRASGRRRSSGPHACSSGSYSYSCSAFVPVTRSSSGSGWSRLGGAGERPTDPAAEDEAPLLLVPPATPEHGGHARAGGAGEVDQDACLDRVWEVNEEDFVVGLDAFLSPAPPAPAPVDPLEPQPPPAPPRGALDDVSQAEAEEIWAAHALARSKGAVPLCARIAEAEELRDLVL